jgi:hypothetical protein
MLFHFSRFSSLQALTKELPFTRKGINNTVVDGGIDYYCHPSELSARFFNVICGAFPNIRSWSRPVQQRVYLSNLEFALNWESVFWDQENLSYYPPPPKKDIFPLPSTC